MAYAGPVALPDVPVHVAEPVLAVLLSPWARIGAFAWGAIWGSFANVVIHRVPRGESIVRPRSRCPGCGTTLGAIENVPILSYLVLRGKCRHCGEPIALRYLVVELLAGLLGFATYMRTVHLPLVEGGAPQLGAWMLVFAFCLALLVVVFVDLDLWIIPDAVVLPMTVVGLVAAAVVPQWLGVDLVPAAIAAASGYLAFAGIRWLYLKWRGIEALGLGDAKLLAMVGAFAGPVGVAWCIGAGALQGLVVAVPMLLTGRRLANTDLHDVHGDDPELGPRSAAQFDDDDSESDGEHDGGEDDRLMGRHVPFGPFLALAALEYILLKDAIDAALGRLLNP
jgi:leader peptidase (prepilin peptidase)/N-methyltransferase